MNPPALLDFEVTGEPRYQSNPLNTSNVAVSTVGSEDGSSKQKRTKADRANVSLRVLTESDIFDHAWLEVTSLFFTWVGSDSTTSKVSLSLFDVCSLFGISTLSAPSGDLGVPVPASHAGFVLVFLGAFFE